MPFLAQGGSSVVTNWAIVALLIRVSHTARKEYDGEVAP
jgi:cell division protein FtsW (lipid II flippase)